MSVPTPTALNPEAQAYIDTLIRRYAFWCGLGFLALNIIAGAAGLWTIWLTVYGAAKEEYQTKIEILQKQWDADQNVFRSEFKKEQQEQLQAFEKSIDTRFNYDYVKQKLTDVTLTAGTLEEKTRVATEKATNAADQAQQTATTARKRAEDALANAEKISIEITRTLDALQKDENVELARSIAILIGLMKENPDAPLGQLGARIQDVEAKIAAGRFDRLVVGSILLTDGDRSTDIRPGTVTVVKQGKKEPLSANLFVENRGDGLHQAGVKVVNSKHSKMIGMDEDGGVNTGLTK